MKNLYAVEWQKYFRQLRENPAPDLVGLYLNNQIAALDHGTVTGLREGYREAWLEESTFYRLGTALARWDHACQYWREVQEHVPEVLRARKPGEPFPSLDALRSRHGQ